MLAKANTQPQLFWPRLMVPVAVLVLWQVIFWIVGRPALASPWESVLDLVRNATEWLPDLWASLIALLVAFAISAFFGVTFGFLIGLSTFWSDVFTPIFQALYSIPKITLYPVFLLMFGVTLAGRVAFSVFSGIFPILLICIAATQAVPPVYLKLARAYSLSFPQKAIHILVPAILPHLVVGLRTGFNLCFLGIILAEMFTAFEGLGFRLMRYTLLIRPSSILALILLIVFIAFLATFLFLLWEERMEVKAARAKMEVL